jgi:hypothetical protein
MATFESVDEFFDEIAEFVPLMTVIASTAIATQWNDQLITSSANLLAQWISVKFLVGNHVFKNFQQDFGTAHVIPFPFGQKWLDLLALAFERDVIYC